jgi:hypothetical protein
MMGQQREERSASMVRLSANDLQVITPYGAEND